MYYIGRGARLSLEESCKNRIVSELRWYKEKHDIVDPYGPISDDPEVKHNPKEIDDATTDNR